MYSDFLVLWAARVTDWKNIFSCIFSCIHHHISIDGGDDGDDYDDDDDDDDVKLNNNWQTPCLVIFTKGLLFPFRNWPRQTADQSQVWDSLFYCIWDTGNVHTIIFS